MFSHFKEFYGGFSLLCARSVFKLECKCRTLQPLPNDIFHIELSNQQFHFPCTESNDYWYIQQPVSFSQSWTPLSTEPLVMLFIVLRVVQYDWRNILRFKIGNLSKYFMYKTLPHKVIFRGIIIERILWFYTIRRLTPFALH